ncbi:ImmA/IrrE family metallo-endopeptidase [Enterococcus faecium]|uniref:ImmA/IrrE family metallo-endopeptidase n=1 Tax=Enterococcus faecium TaxID=1352 RepID=UPI000A35785F|nr:ImmA/IrrE family metallo-endopeptidase [Enterococcus faecium]OTO54145.1 hypothetical protein A5814_002267 [Enterococcus faecium]
MLRRLKELLDGYNLELFYVKMAESGFYYPAAKAVLLNENIYESREENFKLAHELGHFVERHAELAALYASSKYRAKFEFEANKVAITILINIFVEVELTDQSQFTIDRFMNFYSIPSKLRYLCDTVSRDYFKLNTASFCEV